MARQPVMVSIYRMHVQRSKSTYVGQTSQLYMQTSVKSQGQIATFISQKKNTTTKHSDVLIILTSMTLLNQPIFANLWYKNSAKPLKANRHCSLWSINSEPAMFFPLTRRMRSVSCQRSKCVFTISDVILSEGQTRKKLLYFYGENGESNDKQLAKNSSSPRK